MVVLAVAAKSQGAAAGFRPRDVIVGIREAGKEGQDAFEPIADVAALQALVANRPETGQDLDLAVVRDQARITLRLPRPTRKSGAANSMDMEQ